MRLKVQRPLRQYKLNNVCIKITLGNSNLILFSIWINSKKMLKNNFPIAFFISIELPILVKKDLTLSVFFSCWSGKTTISP